MLKEMRLRYIGQGGIVPKPAEPAPQAQGRRYEVPEGLLPRFFELYADLKRAERNGRGAVEAYRIWSLLSQRYPETKKGKWKFTVHGWTRVEVVEVLP
jgi:hypothetical protein